MKFMKQILLLIGVAMFFCLEACHEKTVGYLITENASYDPDTMYVRKTPDPQLDWFRIENKAPWKSLALQGYEGTELIYFYVESVTYEGPLSEAAGEEEAQNFMKNLSVRSGGALEYPFENDAVPGTYKVSIRLTNPGYSHVLQDAMKIIVTE